MRWQYSLYLVHLFVTAGLSFASAFIALRRRRLSGILPLAGLSLAIGVWTAVYGLQLASTDLDTKVLLNNIKFIAVAAVPPLWLVVALQYGRQRQWLTVPTLAVLTAEPMAALLLVWTNRSHGIFWSDSYLSTVGPIPTLVLIPHAGFWGHALFSYTLVVTGWLVLLRALIRSPRPYRGQIAALLFGALSPCIANMLFLLGVTPLPGLDLTPFAFALSSTALIVGFLSFRLLDIIPVAYREVVNQMAHGLIVLDLDHRIVEISTAAQNLIGCAAAELLGEPILEALSGRAEPVAVAYREWIKDPDTPAVQRDVVLDSTPQPRHLDLQMLPLVNQRNRRTGRLIVLRDVSEQRRAEEALREAHNRLERRNRQLAQILQVGDSMRLTLNLDDLLQQIVDSVYESLGFGAIMVSLVDQKNQTVRVRAHIGLDAHGQEMFEGAAYITWKEVSKLLQERFRIGRCYFVPQERFDWGQELREITYGPDGREGAPAEPEVDAWQPYDALLVPVELREGQVAGLISVDRPLDGRRPSADTLQALEIFANQVGIAIENAWLYEKLQEELEERARTAEELQEAKEAAEAADRAKGVFLANISHEVRTPLTAVIGYSEFLQEEALDRGYSDIIPDLEKIRIAGNHLLSLINEILDLSKIEADRMGLSLESFAAQPMIEEVVYTIRPLVKRKGNTLNVHYVNPLGAMHTDQTKVRQILLNLLGNAAKFTENGTITFSASRETLDDGDWLAFCITDSGIGMSRDQLDFLFEPFTQADMSIADKYGGTGLGLAISRRFCALLGGEIGAASEEGKGSVFTVRLPAEAPQQAVETAELLAESGSAPETPREGRTVLLISDDADLREWIAPTLAREAYLLECTSATGCPDAADRCRPRAILLDLLAAEPSAWTLLAMMKSHPKLATVPIITLALRENKGHVLGVTDCLSDPIDEAQFRAVVQRHLHKGSLVRSISGPHALIVERDLSRRQSLRALLEAAGWSVAEAENGRTAIVHVAQWRPDLIFLNPLLPHMDGFRFITELRRTLVWRWIPIVLILKEGLPAADRAQLDTGLEHVLKQTTCDASDLLQEVGEMLVLCLSPWEIERIEQQQGYMRNIPRGEQRGGP